MEKFTRFARIAETEFSDIIISTHDLGHKLRIYLKDKSFIDFFYTTKLDRLRFAIHWERTHLDKNIYRIDNTPDKKWQTVKSYPIHFHNKSYDNVDSPPFAANSKSLEGVFRNFLKFASSKLD